MPSRELGFEVFDADNHYYEAEDAFTGEYVVTDVYDSGGERWPKIGDTVDQTSRVAISCGLLSLGHITITIK